MVLCWRDDGAPVVGGAAASVRVLGRGRERRAAGSWSPRVRGAVSIWAPVGGLVVVQQLLFPVDAGFVLQGATIGALTALTAVGMALVYRANRVLNFAQADLGYVPGLLGVLLVSVSGLSYGVGLVSGLGAAIVLGAGVELLVVRRFSNRARLVLTVVTLGIGQLLVFAALRTAEWWEAPTQSQRVRFPWSTSFSAGSLVFHQDHIVVWVAAPIVLLGVAVFLRRSIVGVAIRGAAERSDLASSLGIPVSRLHTVVWSLATTLAFVALWLRSGVFGLPVGAALAFGTLLRALASLSLGGFTHIPAVVGSAVALGVLESAMVAHNRAPSEVSAVMAAVIVLALLLRSLLDKADTRVSSDATSSWLTIDDPSEVPSELRRIPEVVAVRVASAFVVGGLAFVMPLALDTSNLIKATAVVIYAIIGLSVVVLTGWAGQVSLGQMAFVAIGAALTAKLSHEWQVDLFVALASCALVGALTAVVVGLPALRQQGLLLAVTTLGLSLVTTAYLLNDDFWVGAWVHNGRFERLPLLGRIAVDSPLRMYYLALGVLAAVLVSVRGLRQSRTGRALLAMRENEAAAQSFGVSPVRVKLTGFAVSGAVASVAGGLFAYNLRVYSPDEFGPAASIEVFTMAVVGGLGTVGGAVLGALYLQGASWFLPVDWRFLATGAGVLLVLLVLPSGLAGGLLWLRDRLLRFVARRRRIIVPSLVADGAENRPPAGGGSTPPRVGGAAGSWQERGSK